MTRDPAGAGREIGASAPDRHIDAPTSSESADLAREGGTQIQPARAGGAQRGLAREGGDEVVVDARGLVCPAPVIALAKAARGLSEGARVTVLATDPAAAVDVPAWARMRGHRMLETTKDGEHLVLTVLLGPGTKPVS